MTAGDVLPGRAGQLHAQATNPIELADLYSPAGAHIYDLLTEGDNHDARPLIDLVGPVCGDLLELGCGSGRLVTPLLAAGWPVTALDSSPVMLDLLRAKLPERLLARCTPVLGDMADFSLGRKFEVIVLATGTITLLDRARRESLFTAIRAHLTDGGRLVVSAVDVSAEIDTEIPLGDYTFYEYADLITGRRTITVVPAQGNRWYTTTTHILGSATLGAELIEAGLDVRKKIPITHPDERHRKVALIATAESP